jgi:hypothetical protein
MLISGDCSAITACACRGLVFFFFVYCNWFTWKALPANPLLILTPPATPSISNVLQKPATPQLPLTPTPKNWRDLSTQASNPVLSSLPQPSIRYFLCVIKVSFVGSDSPLESVEHYHRPLQQVYTNKIF